ncbi:MAG: aldehyde ferredoxin oxidoreductase family protein [Thermodesulfobacteriota bacterium]|nr:aldehyde ferredoxin oxidoreductase family protein [Thermodesulfobacteriota bacterium]
MAGYLGKILWVDLTSKRFREDTPSKDVYQNYLGGYGLGVYYIYKNLKPKTDPLGPDNILGFCPGLFTGTLAPLTGRCMVCAKSPLTLTWGDSNIGGFLGVSIKRAGWDAIFFTGASKNPVYLLAGDETLELIDASDLWGIDAIEGEKRLKERHGKNAQAAIIGPAGENQSLISGIVSSGGRIAARSGLGAVMGSKNLKAVCLNGKGKADHVDKAMTLALVKEYNKRLSRNMDNLSAKMATKIGPSFATFMRLTKGNMSQSHAIATRVFRLYGSSFATNVQIAVGDTPVKNFAGVGYRDFPDKIAKEFNTQNLKKWITGSQGCFNCPIQCGHVMKVPELNIERTHRPEYETLASFGPLVMNKDVEKIIEINDYLNRAGMDTISAGVTVAFAIECCEKGILVKKDFVCKEFPDGFLPGWGEPEYLMPLLKMMVNKEGIGEHLAKGVQEASRYIGKGSSEFAMAANGQEIPMHDPRKIKGLMVTYLTDPTPGRHTAAGLEYSSIGEINHFIDNIKFKLGKDPLVAGAEHARWAKVMQVTNSIGLCEYAVWFEKYPLLEFFKSIVGWDYTVDDIYKIGGRIQVLRQMFNAREGKIGFNIPGRVYGVPPLEKGPLANVRLQPARFIKEYFKNMGFDDKGVPKQETLEQLGLDFCIKDLVSASGAPIPEFE